MANQTPTQRLATDFVALCNGGARDDAGCKAAFERAAAKYWADDVVAVEPMEGPMARLTGRAAVKSKTDWWNNTHAIHSAISHGPYVNGEQFAVRFVLDVTNNENGQRMQMDEVGLYTVKNGKIVEERFFY